MISITELAQLFEVSVRTIRYYEELGLIEELDRIGGKRHFSRKSTIKKMEDIIFLKSLHFKLYEIRKILENPLWVKPLMQNIRLGLARIEVEELEAEILELERKLTFYGWDEIEVIDKSILEKMILEYIDLEKLEKNIRRNNQRTPEDSKKFITAYKEWHKKIGIPIRDEHIEIIAFSEETLKENELKKVFQEYFYKD